MRPLYAHTLTSSECEIPDHESITPSPSSVEPAVSLGPSTPVVKEHSTHLSRSPVSTLAASITEGTPEWYLKKLQDKTVDAQQLVTLQTILKGKDTRYDLSSENVKPELKSRCAAGLIVSLNFVECPSWPIGYINLVRRRVLGRSPAV